MKHKVTATVQFSCSSCESSELRLVGGVKTEDDKTYIVCQCLGCGAQVPLSTDAIVMKLYEIAPPKQVN